MPEIDPWKHADFIYACYIIVGVATALLTLWIVRDERKQQELLDDMDNSQNNERDA